MMLLETVLIFMQPLQELELFLGQSLTADAAGKEINKNSKKFKNINCFWQRG